MRFSQHQISSDCDFEGKPPSGNDSISGPFDIVIISQAMGGGGVHMFVGICYYWTTYSKK
jgi:hypothetical protein